ncbi:unnamed protein product [Owenia fusiformis]|uniref:Protein ABHD14A n=1 Tax=Owenia fusiformis TaxID=6347 RepID=A0A8J1TYM5_OWEFU|nr:unnamed protein product [Owenia fusiformis]
MRSEPTHQLKMFKTWKRRETRSLPEDIEAKSEKVDVKVKERTFTYQSQEVKLHYLEASPASEPKLHILLLHGAAFSSKNWEEIKTLHLIAAMGHLAIAIDLPGASKSKTKGIKISDRADFLDTVIKQLDIKKPIIVSPSMSGGYSLPFIMGSNSETCTDRALGFIPVAPVGTDNYKPVQYNRCQLPTMIVYGDQDSGLGLTSLGNLRNLPNSEIFPIKGGSHPCYLDEPEYWNKLVYNFLLEIESDQNSK